MNTENYITKHQPLVSISGNRLITTSLAVSNHFDKKHKHVLEAIEKLECSQSFREPNFRPSSYTTSQGKQLPMVEITRDGFMFLCMGFTGKAAARWKERYITAFNALEQSLHDNAGNLAQMQGELLKSRPLWKQIKRYKALGLNHVEIGKLTGYTKQTIRDHVRKMEACGILQPPKNLAKLQQLSLNFAQPTHAIAIDCAAVSDWERDNLPVSEWNKGYSADNPPANLQALRERAQNPVVLKQGGEK